MKFFSAVCFAALVAAVSADTTLQPSGFNAYANTEFGYGSSMVTFGYPGYSDSFVDEIEAQLHRVDVDDATNRVTGSAEKVFTYYITSAQKPKPAVMTFAVPNAENDKIYAVRYCKKDTQDESECSAFSSGSPIKTGTGHKLDCTEFDPSITAEVDVPAMGGIIGYADSRMMGSVSTDDDSTMKIQGFNEMKHRQIMKVGSNGWFAYFVLKVDLSGYSKLLESTARKGYCARKFQLSVLTHFLKEGTDKDGNKYYKVIKTLKFAPYLTQAAALALANTTGFPLEIQGKLANNDDEKPFSDIGLDTGVIVWHTVCLTDKDSAFGAVKCAQPFRPDGENKWDWKKDTITDNGRIGL